MVPPITIGIDRNPFKEPPDHSTARSIEPFSFKLPFMEYIT